MNGKHDVIQDLYNIEIVESICKEKKKEKIGRFTAGGIHQSELMMVMMKCREKKRQQKKQQQHEEEREKKKRAEENELPSDITCAFCISCKIVAVFHV